ncbi:multimerin-1-like isoform X2 [Polyodon spathula]|uniref:multimerin-1-like isoform X2 n=1 Tax=Polyodon spathula TaxID=7913 RepID=UPI001B7EB802|nr:multimerin-1-like isoform X2 [Polyodon spathula]
MKWIVLSFVYMLSGVYGFFLNNTNNGTADGHIPVDNSSISTNNITGNSIRLKTNYFEGLVRSIKLPQPTVKAPEEAKADEATTRLKHAKEQVTIQNGAKGVPSGNKLSRQTYSKISISKPSFETTRGKNWCAYVHTRLSPTVVMDNVESYVTMSTDPCSWNTGGCPVRYQMMNRPAYRMKHKIVTSLEWKCCPGYIGSKCEPKAQQSQTPVSESQAESDTAVSEGPAADQQTTDPALTQKMTDQIYSQEMKLTILQKKIDSISTNMSDIRSMLFSLEGKINEERGKDPQSTLKDFKTKGISDLVKEIVQEQLKVYQDSTQETVAQLFKTVSILTEELETTKETVHRLNKTMSSVSTNYMPLLKNNNQTKTNIQNIQNGMTTLREEVFSTCDSITKELIEKQKSLEEEFELEREKNNVYYETINHTLSQMREIHEQLQSGEQLESPTVPQNDNVTEHVSLLSETVKKQSLVILQLHDELSAQNIKISNLTLADRHQRELAKTTCELQNQMEKMEDHMNILNKTVCDTIMPMDDMFSVMEERISHMSYDLEELKPFIEKETFQKDDPSSELNSELLTMKKQIDSLKSTVNKLNLKTQYLMKSQDELGNLTREKEAQFDKHLDRCRMEIEDGLNDTMTVINDAIDSVKDNYYVLQNDVASIHSYVNVTHHDITEKVETVLGKIPQFVQMNYPLKAIQDKTDMLDNTLRAIGIFSDQLLKDSENNRPPNLVKVSQQLNEAVSIIEDHQQAIKRLEEKPSSSSQDLKTIKLRLQSVESRLNLLIAKSQKSKLSPEEKNALPPTKYQELNNKVKELVAQSLNQTNDILSLKATVSKAWVLCQNVSSSHEMMQASGPLLSKEDQLNITVLHERLKELLNPTHEATSRLILANITLYVETAISSIFKDVTKLQKQMRQLSKKQETALKLTLNATTTLPNRSQRNTENAIVSEYNSCSSSPCQNGGTCINERSAHVCACRPPFGGVNCSIKLVNESNLSTDFSKGSYRYAPMVTFFVAHTFEMKDSGIIKFNHLYVNYGASYSPGSGKFVIPYLGVYVFKYTIESSSPQVAGYLVVDEVDKLAFQSEAATTAVYSSSLITGDAMLELNYGQKVWLRLEKGSIPSKYPPVTTFGGYLLYRT